MNAMDSVDAADAADEAIEANEANEANEAIEAKETNEAPSKLNRVSESAQIDELMLIERYLLKLHPLILVSLKSFTHDSLKAERQLTVIALSLSYERLEYVIALRTMLSFESGKYDNFMPKEQNETRLNPLIHESATIVCHLSYESLTYEQKAQMLIIHFVVKSEDLIRKPLN